MLCVVSGMLCLFYICKKENLILIKKKTKHDSATHQGVVAQTVFEVLCCASSRILPNNIPDPKKNKKLKSALLSVIQRL